MFLFMFTLTLLHFFYKHSLYNYFLIYTEVPLKVKFFYRMDLQCVTALTECTESGTTMQ